jgi:hypothetical protein
MIATGNGLALGDFSVEAVELGQDHSALQRIHPSARANARMHMPLTLPMNTNLPTGLGQGIVIGKDCGAAGLHTYSSREGVFGQQAAKRCVDGRNHWLIKVPGD